MELSKTALALALILSLSACGGGGGDGGTSDPNPTPPTDSDDGSDQPDQDEEQPQNSAPVAFNDYGQTNNDQGVNLNVLDNDSDDDGDELTLDAITVEPVNGTVAIDGNVAVYTPNVGYYGMDSFSYRISDGEHTAEGKATITVGQEVVVEGVVADSLDGEVKVSVDLGDEKVSTMSDNEGRYELSFVVTKPHDMITLNSEQKASGMTLKLASVLGSSESLTQSAASQSNRRLSDSFLPKTTLSYLSTALWLYYEDQRGDSAASLEDFQDFVRTLNLVQALDTASFMKVTATNADYDVGDANDNISFFSESGAAIEDTIFDHLMAKGAVDQTGEFSAAYEEAFNQARTEMIKNTRLANAISDSEVAGNIWAQVRVRGDFSAETDKALTFNSDGTGTETGLWSDWKATRVEDLPYSWSLSDSGTVQISYEDNSNGFTFSCNGDERYALFSEEALLKAQSVCSLGSVNVIPGFKTKKSMELSKITSVEGMTHFQAESQYEYTMALSQFNLEGLEDYTAQDTELDVRTYATDPQSVPVDEDMLTASRWTVTVPSTMEYTLPAPGDLVSFSGYFPDLINFMDSGAFTSENTSQDGTWTLSDGAIKLNFASDTVTVKPFLQTESSLLTLVTIENDTEAFTFVSEMVQEDTASLESFDLTHELPVLWSSLSHCPVEGCWTFGKMKARKFAGFSFSDDGTMAWLNANQDNTAFERASPESTVTWQRDGNFIRIDGRGMYDGDTFLEYRTWELIQVTDDGWVKVIERYSIHLFYADENQPSESFIYKPHIETLRLTDLSEEFPNMWSQTVANGG